MTLDQFKDALRRLKRAEPPIPTTGTGSVDPAPSTGKARAGRGAAAIGRMEDAMHRQFPPEEFEGQQFSAGEFVADEREEQK